MVERVAKPAKSVRADGNENVGEGLSTFLEANGQNLDAFARSGEAFGNGLAALGEEMVAFGNAQLRTQFENSETMMTCHDFEEVFALQCNYLNKAAEQYARETGKVVGMMTEMTRNCMAPFEQRTKAALHEIDQH